MSYKKMHQDWIVRIFISIPLLSSLIMMICIWYYGPSLEIEWSTEGFKYFKEKFGFALYVAALAIPLGGIAISNFRANQAKEQLELTQAQNNFTNYYKHYEEFKNTIKQLENSYKIKFYSKSKTYKYLFPNNSILTPNFTSDEIIFLIEKHIKLQQFISKTIKELNINPQELSKESILLAVIILMEIKEFQNLLKYEMNDVKTSLFINIIEIKISFTPQTNMTKDFETISEIIEVLKDFSIAANEILFKVPYFEITNNTSLILSTFISSPFADDLHENGNKRDHTHISITHNDILYFKSLYSKFTQEVQLNKLKRQLKKQFFKFNN